MTAFSMVFHIRGCFVWFHLDTDSFDSYCILVAYGAEVHRKYVPVKLVTEVKG